MKKLRIIFALSIALVTFYACEKKPNITMTEAVKIGNEQAVKYYLKHGEMVNQKDEEGNPLIILAVKQGSVPIIKRLLKAGADVNAKDKNGMTSLVYAITQGDTDTPDVHSEADFDVLMEQIGKGNAQIVKLLLESGAEVNSK